MTKEPNTGNASEENQDGFLMGSVPNEADRDKRRKAKRAPAQDASTTTRGHSEAFQFDRPRDKALKRGFRITLLKVAAEAQNGPPAGRNQLFQQTSQDDHRGQ